MSLLTLFNLTGKPKRELIKPRENVGRQILSDGFSGRKIVPKDIGEVIIKNFGVTLASSGGIVYTTLVDEWIDSDAKSIDLILLNSRVKFKDDSGAAVWTLLYAGIEVWLDGGTLTPEKRASAALNPNVGVPYGWAEITSNVYNYTFWGTEKGFQLLIKAYCISSGATANRYAELSGQCLILKVKR